MNHFPKNLPDRLRSNSATIAVIGMGYVGRPLFEVLDKQYTVIGFDIAEDHIASLKSRGLSTAQLTSNPEDLAGVSVYIVCVPTDIHQDKTPDLTHLLAAAHMIGQLLQPESVVIFESTVYPGCTEEECIPILEKQSGLQVNREFWVGYAPERLVPGVADRTIRNVSRVVGGSSKGCTEFLVKFYASFIKEPIHQASSIQIAEASKIVENIQRDLNISLMNELSIIFDKMNIDTQEVLEAAATKWNFHSYSPGLVGGHCISVDPFYLLHKARALGIEPNVIAAGRAINEYLPLYISEKLEHTLAGQDISIDGAHILVFGVTFKENVDDIRNSKVLDLLHHLTNKKARLSVIDPHVTKEKAAQYNIPLIDKPSTDFTYDAIIIAVKHTEFYHLSTDHLRSLLNESKVLFDLKRIMLASEREKFAYWAL